MNEGDVSDRCAEVLSDGSSGISVPVRTILRISSEIDVQECSFTAQTVPDGAFRADIRLAVANLVTRQPAFRIVELS